MKKNNELMIEVADLYQNTGFGYRRIRNYLEETRNISISYMTIKRWIEEMGLEKHSANQVKAYSKAWYKNKSLDLEKRYNDLQEKCLRMNNNLDSAQKEIEYLKDDISLLREQNLELRKIAIKAFKAGLICKDMFKKVTKII